MTEPKFESSSVTSKLAFLNNNNNNNDNITVMVEVIVWTYIVLVMCQVVLQFFPYMNSNCTFLVHSDIMSIKYETVYIYICTYI